jgi:hypothetical protein
VSAAAAKLRVLVLGWHGSKERHLRPIARAWESLGLEPRIVVPETWRAMSFRNGWPRLGQRLLDAHGGDGPWIAHAFSNAGFWSLCAMLSAASERAPAVLAAHTGTVLDSAPGFPENVSPLFTAKYASMAMTPSLLAALGRPQREVHPLVTPPLAAFLGLWHFVARDQVRFMESSQSRFLSLHQGKPLLSIYGGADRLVRPKYVESFLERASAANVPVDRLYFPESRHVRHFVEHRHEVTDHLRAFVARAR